MLLSWLAALRHENKRRGWRGLWFPSQDDEVARLMSRCFGLTTCEIPLLPRSPPADAAHHVRHFNERCPHFSGIQFLPMMKWWSEAPGPASWQPIIESPQIEKNKAASPRVTFLCLQVLHLLIFPPCSREKTIFGYNAYVCINAWWHYKMCRMCRNNSNRAHNRQQQ